jgi:murein DD-endopeptidase MepM/ murein hydrolase activator NlpD
MKYKLPILSLEKPILTLPYGDKSMVQWYLANGLNLTEHNGVDYITGQAVETYGTPLVCPFPEAKVVKINFDTPMATKGNGVTIEAKIGSKRYQIVYWHTGEVAVKLNQIVNEGDVICYIGNSGLCRPAPSPQRPYDGAHLHLMLFVNGILKDPLTLFGKDQWYLGEHKDASKDIHPLVWAWEKLGITDWWMKMLMAFRWWR